MANIIRKHIRNAGLWLVYAGLMMLMANSLVIKHHTGILQLSPLLLITAGIMVHVIILKKQSKY